MCNNPCDRLKIAVCEFEHGCDGPFLMPCNHTCFIFKTHWAERDKEKNYHIPACAACSTNIPSATKNRLAECTGVCMECDIASICINVNKGD